MRYPGEKAIEDKIQEMLPFYADAYDLYFLNLFLNSHVSQHPVDEIELLFSEKTKIAKVSAIQLLSLIRERKLLKERSLEKISNDTDDCRTRILNIRQSDYASDEEYFHASQSRESLENKILELRKEKREAELSCWQDIVMLRKELLISMLDYKSNVSKKKLLSQIIE